MAKIIKIDENTWRFEDGFVRFFLLEGENSAVMIDSGMNCPDAAELAKTLTDKPVMLVNTHGDMDHTSGTRGFDKIYMHTFDYVQCDMAKKFPETKLMELEDGNIIELGDRTLRIIHIPGHTTGSIAILDIEKRVLYAGDSVQKGIIYMFGPQREPEQFENSLQKLISMESEYDCIYASHDEYKVPNDYGKKVLEGWKQVQKAEIPYEMVEMFGKSVKCYKTEFCGFYVE